MKFSFRKKLATLFLFIFVFISSIGISYLIAGTLNSKNLNSVVAEAAVSTSVTPTEDPKFHDELKNEYKFQKIVGWIPSFDYDRGKNSFYKNINKFTDISPVYYDLKEDGTTSSRSIAGDKDLITKAHKANVKVIPTILSFSENALQAMLTDPVKFKNHNTYLVTEIDKYGYDGIDIDYESINRTEKDLYMDFLKDLSTRLHAKGKILSVAVVPKDKDTGYTTLIETREVQDWARMSEFADEIRVMAYDYSSISTKGPISPVYWVENILKYAAEKGVTNKTILGQPFYGYAYGKERYAYTYDEISALIKIQNITPKLDPITEEKSFPFTKGSEERVMYYNDHETLITKIHVADKYKALGVAFWRLGGEDEKIYEKLEKQR